MRLPSVPLDPPTFGVELAQELPNVGQIGKRFPCIVFRPIAFPSNEIMILRLPRRTDGLVQ